MDGQIDVIIIGGGLAGLTSAIHLAKAGKAVLLVEKQVFPHHKVCGEYLSNEVIPYLQWLDADPYTLSPVDISRLQVSTESGRSCNIKLPLGGLGISRYALDAYLYRKAIAAGCMVLQETVKAVTFDGDKHVVRTANGAYQARLVLGAYGKRSGLDHKLGRAFIQERSPWLAVKAHYKTDFPSGLVALHNFQGGYCGVSNVENGLTNICYLVDYESFKSHKDLRRFQEAVLFKNKNLRSILEAAELSFHSPLTISQICFGSKELVEEHILMIGDTAGLIHPLCGNGMGMAIHSAQLASRLVLDFLDGKINSRFTLENSYQQQWKSNFSLRIRMGKILSTIMNKERLADVMMSGLVRVPQILAPVIRMTHGSPLTIPQYG
jgi:flavin-dependent dehydrogenase